MNYECDLNMNSLRNKFDGLHEIIQDKIDIFLFLVSRTKLEIVLVQLRNI